MFENDIEMLKKELERMVQKYNWLETELVANNKKERDAKRLIELESEVKDDFSDFIDKCLASGVAILLACILFILMQPISSLVYLVALLCTSIPALIFILDSLFSWLNVRGEYNTLASDENLELVDNLDNIKARGLELNQESNHLEEMISNYSELVGYLTDYNDMITYLDLIKKGKIEEVNKAFDEYLEERIDYSKVHLCESVLPEKIHLKKLTNIVK